MTEPINILDYMSVPRIDTAGGLALGQALLSARPDPASPDVQRWLRQLELAVTRVATEWKLRLDPIATKDRRPADLTTDNAWAILERRLDAYARLPTHLYPRAARAREIHQLLFRQGMGWLTLPYEAEWAESQQRLDLIDQHQLAADLDELAGAEFLAEVRRAHKLYGLALGITQPLALSAPPPATLEALNGLSQMIRRYTLALLSMLDPDDPSVEEQVRAALAPLDRYREGQLRRNEAAQRAAEQAATPPVEPEHPEAPPAHP